MKKLLFLLFFIVFLWPSLSEARLYIDIDSPLGRRLPIAIDDLQMIGKSMDPRERQLNAHVFHQYRAILERDLKMTGLFRILNPDSNLESKNAGPTAAETQFSLWKLAGADALVKAGLKTKDGQYSIEMRLFDVHQQISIVGKRYYFNLDDFPKVIHSFADQIILKLTGEKGVFATTKILSIGMVGNYKEVFMMDPDGNNLQQITRLQSITLSPDWSRDGRYIAYTSFAWGNPDLYLHDLKSHKAKRISARKGLNLGASFAHHADLIAVAISDNSDAELKVLNYRGKIKRTLTENWWIDIEPAWSPDGKFIAFVSNKSGKPHIYRCDADGSNVVRLTYKGFHNVSPAWSPRGDQIAFAGKDKGKFDIFIMNPNGRNTQRLTINSGNNEAPSWSPNGQMIVFHSNRRGKKQLYVMGNDGRGQIQITDGVGNYSNPVWSPWL